MNPKISSLLNQNKVCVFAIEMPDGSPHAATVHFAHTDEPLLFIFETNRGYRKAEALLGKNESRASMVVGTRDDSDMTFQLDGIASITKDEKLIDIYLQKFPNKAKKVRDPSFIMFIFKPTWWRFTDFSGEEKQITLSDQTKNSQA